MKKTTLSLILSLLALLADVPAAQSQPVLSIAPAGNQSVVYWPIASTNYILQSATNLAAPVWTPVTGGGLVTGVVVSNTSPASYFRLLAPAPPAGMVVIPAGSFTMGDPLNDNTNNNLEIPTHTVYVSAIYMDQSDVTEALWAQVYNWATNNGYSFTRLGSVYDGHTKGTNYPVTYVRWDDCVKWCNARSEMAGKTPAYYTDGSQTVVYRTGILNLDNSSVNWNGGYRLPTEAEWEKAARAGRSGQRFPWGNTINESQANYQADPFALDSASGLAYDVNAYLGYNTNFNTGILFTSPVNAFAPNGYGLYDMAGNVSQWCWDSFALYGSAPQTDPHGPTAAGNRMVRGGDWIQSAFYSRAAYRQDTGVGSTLNYIGFRCVLTPGQ